MVWQKGQSGNPGGRPKGVEKKFRDDIAATKCKDVTEVTGPDGAPVLGSDGLPLKSARWVDAWEMARLRLVRIMQFGEDKDAIAAIKLMYERAFGKPRESVDMTVADVTDEQRRMLEALKMTPHERRRALAQDSTATDADADSAAEEADAFDS